MIKAFFVIISFFFASQFSLAFEDKNNTEFSYFFRADLQETLFSFDTHLYISKSKGDLTESLAQTELQKIVKFIKVPRELWSKQGMSSFRDVKVKVLEIKNMPSSEKYNYVRYIVTGFGFFKHAAKSFVYRLPTIDEDSFNKFESKCRAENEEDLSPAQKKAAKDNNTGEGHDWWYEWTPDMCPNTLITNKYYLEISLKNINFLFKNTNDIFPKYSELIRNNILSTTVFYGLGGLEDKEAVKNLSDKFSNLIREGFKVRQLDEAEITKIVGHKVIPTPSIVEAKLSTDLGDLIIRTVFVNADFNLKDNNTKIFHYFLKDSLENDSVTIYAGHAGLGRNLNLAEIEKLQGFKIKPLNQYQIYYVAACYGHKYFTDIFNFQNKDNTQKTFDIMSYAYPYSLSLVGRKQNLINALKDYMKFKKETSYQQMIKDESASFGVIRFNNNKIADK